MCAESCITLTPCVPVALSRQLAFAPRQHGLVLAAASEDGCIYVWEADRPLAPTCWTLQSKIQARTTRGVKQKKRCGKQKMLHYMVHYGNAFIQGTKFLSAICKA